MGTASSSFSCGKQQLTLNRVLVFLKLWFLSFVHFKVLFLEEDELLPLRFTIYSWKGYVYLGWSSIGKYQPRLE